ncbi:hypothetical protein Cni_G10810 [Canna indica]|uniref:tRNA-splicing endonuclease subunit Sen54 N-terminal domain-containing protein n=1 Tax=Canna indica TaxID=4628 RepID=A0AAQ3Q7N0_9LILI|nr:hypothetical protein Cni_G10810 [Canna indica]
MTSSSSLAAGPSSQRRNTGCDSIDCLISLSHGSIKPTVGTDYGIRSMARNGGLRAKDDEEEEQHQNPFLFNNKSLTSRPQFRSEVSKAHWDEEMDMGEIIEKKGSIWTTTGIIRNGKLYCHIEEILFLAERGALILTSADGKTFNLGDIYKKVIASNLGSSWEYFQAYRHLKSLGYIVKRHDIPWTLKNNRSCCGSNSPSETNGRTCEVEFGISDLLQGMQIHDLKPAFDVYLPNSKFKKSSPGDPSFLLCLLREDPPSRSEVENLEKKCDGLPLKFCYVDHGRVSFFSFDKGTLPILP